MKAALIIFGFAVIGTFLGILLCLLPWWVSEYRERRKNALQLKEWRRKRHRAPIIKVGSRDNLHGWRFYIRPNTFPAVGADPETGESIFMGYSESELREIASCPSEFEQPELGWFVREE